MYKQINPGCSASNRAFNLQPLLANRSNQLKVAIHIASQPYKQETRVFKGKQNEQCKQKYQSGKFKTRGAFRWTLVETLFRRRISFKRFCVASALTGLNTGNPGCCIITIRKGQVRLSTMSYLIRWENVFILLVYLSYLFRTKEVNFASNIVMCHVYNGNIVVMVKVH